MRVVPVIVSPVLVVLVACGGHKGGSGDDDGGTGGPADACIGLQCDVPDCRAMAKSDTSVSGTVFAPNGTLPLYGVYVYVPGTDPGPYPDGAQCSRCSDSLPGNPVAMTISDEGGRFSLSGIPAGDNIPVVITTGKWRKRIMLSHVDACSANPLPAADTTLPRDRTQGDMPQIAITTGMADSLECLVRKLGVSDTEITTDKGSGRVHLYAGNLGKDKFKLGFPGSPNGDSFSDAQSLWGNLDKMKQYDIVMFSCEGAPYPERKPQAAMDAVKAYADFGGRVFASHWHNVWIEGTADDHQQKPAVWPDIATWTNNEDELMANTTSIIDQQANPKGQQFASWMLNVMGSAERGKILLQNQTSTLSTGRSTCSAVDPAKAERWVYLPDQGGGPQNFQFTTPNEGPEDLRCGKVVFSDMHVSGLAGSGTYPDSCGTNNQMTPQEKALAFMFFDIASCVGVIF